jgi:hypothetical protein
LEAAKASTWKDGFLQVQDGMLKYPFINSSGKAMLSGIYAAKQRASAAGDKKLVDICNKITSGMFSKNEQDAESYDTITEEELLVENIFGEEQMEKAIETLLAVAEAMKLATAQLTETNKLMSEHLSSLKAAPAPQAAPVEVKQETVTAPVQQAAATENQPSEADKKLEALVAAITKLAEQNSAILEGITKLAVPAVQQVKTEEAPKSETNAQTTAAPVTEPAAPATTTPEQNGNAPAGEQKPQVSKFGKHAKGLLGTL